MGGRLKEAWRNQDPGSLASRPKSLGWNIPDFAYCGMKRKDPDLVIQVHWMHLGKNEPVLGEFVMR